MDDGSCVSINIHINSSKKKGSSLNKKKETSSTSNVHVCRSEIKKENDCSWRALTLLLDTYVFQYLWLVQIQLETSSVVQNILSI